MGGSCDLVPVILVLILTVTGTQAECTDRELFTLLQCILPYTENYKMFKIGDSCNRALIHTDVCNDFAAMVVCVNQKDVSRTACRPYAVRQIDQRLVISCKVTDFKEVCRKAPAIDFEDFVQTKN